MSSPGVCDHKVIEKTVEWTRKYYYKRQDLRHILFKGLIIYTNLERVGKENFYCAVKKANSK